MKRTLLLIIFISLSLCGRAFSQLKLETAIVDQYYCPGDDDLDGLSLNLKLEFTNVGAQTIILDRDSSQIGQMIVSKNDNGVVGDREANPVFTWVSSGEWKATTADLNRLFVTLMPNETYETTTTARVFVFRENRSGIPGAVGNGKHFLRLRVSTWFGSRADADRLQESWKERGKVWTNSVLSEPMPFTVVPNRRLTKCR